MDPMTEYIRRAQHRKTVTGLQLEIHFGLRKKELNMPRGGGVTPTTLPALAQSKISDCRTHVAPLLKHGVSLGIFAWGQGPTGIEMHNRYVLTEIGGVGVHHGLDQGIAAKAELDDLTILSAEQHAERWERHASTSKIYTLHGQATLP